MYESDNDVETIVEELLSQFGNEVEAGVEAGFKAGGRALGLDGEGQSNCRRARDTGIDPGLYDDIR